MNKLYHHAELAASAIEGNLASLNIETQSAAALEEFLLQHSDGSWQTEAGGIRQHHRRRYEHLRHGGWKVEGSDWETGEPSTYGRVKPDVPFIAKDGKAIKYESQKGASSHPFYPRVTWRVAYECSARQGVEEQFIAECGVSVNPHGECKRFWQFWHNRGLPVAITEGEKKALSLCSHGVAAIGIGGIWMLRKPKERDTLHPEIASFLVKGQLVTVFFDEDIKPKTRRSVQMASREAYRLLSAHGCGVRFAEWLPEQGKGIDDYLASGGNLDELMAGVESYHQMIRNQSQELRNARIVKKNWQNDRYINLLSDIRWWHDKMIAIKAPKGAGKSTIIPELQKLLPALYPKWEQWVQDDGESQMNAADYAILNGEYPAIFGVTYRQSLEGESCGKWELEPADAMKRTGVSPLVCGGTVACIDSIHSNGRLKTDPAIFEDTPVILVIDEIKSVLIHLLSSKTDVAKHRIDSINRLRDILGAVARNPWGRIIAMDADLSQWEVDFIQELAGLDGDQIGVYDFRYEHEIRRTAYRHKSQESVYLKLLDCLQKGQKVLVHTDRQKGKSSWSSTGLEGMLSQSLTQPLTILRVDAETLGDPENAAFGSLSRLEELACEYSCLVMSPSVESGVSISKETPIDAVFYLGSGVVSVAAALQTIERYRGDCDRHYFVPKRASQGQRMKGNGSSSPYSVLRGERAKTGITDSQLKRQMAELSKLEDFDADIAIESNSIAAFLWSQYAAEENDTRRDYRRYFEDGLLAAGYRIEDAPWDNDDGGKQKEVREQVKTKKEELKSIQNEAVASADPIDADEAAKLADGRSMTKPKRNSLKQYQVAKAFALKEGERPSPEQCAEYFDGKLQGARLHYAITAGRSSAKKAQCISKHETKSTNPDGVLVSDANDKWQEWLYAIMETLDIPGLLKLLSQDGKTFDRESPELQPYMDRFLQLQRSKYATVVPGLSKATANQILGNGGGGNAIAWVQLILRRLGLPTLKSCKRPKGDRRLRLYSWEGVPSDREELFTRWLERDNERVADFEWEHTRRQRYEESVLRMEDKTDAA